MLPDVRLFDLNIENVLEDWEVYHAVREVVANALDEQVLTKTKEIEISKDAKGSWHIRDFGRGLRYEHLTQNENEEKLSHPDLVIGKFGVGLKDALATFERHSIKVLMKSRYGDITVVKSEKHGFEEIVTLHASISPSSDSNFQGTELVLEGCSDEDIEIAKGFFLKFSGETILEDTVYGSVLKKAGQSRIYINGLRVAEEENFLFSYNITSITQAMRKALNREKTHLGRAAYTDRVKTILLACKSKDVVELLANDLQEYETGMMHDELKWNDVSVHASKLLNASDNVIFLTPEQLVEAKDIVDNAKNDGLRVVPVPENIREKIRGIEDYAGRGIRDLSSFKHDWNQSFKFKYVERKDLTDEERIVFDSTTRVADLIGGFPANVKQVLISETMRIEACGLREAEGLWESSDRSIIIKRDQLRSLEKYSGTLLHEIAHAISGTSDVSREFEGQLTSLLGLISSNVLTRNSDPRRRPGLKFW